MNQPARITHLSNYLRDLMRDVVAQGKVAKIEGNPVQVAAVAILSGGVAVAETLWEDLSILGGGAKATAKVMARPIAEQITAKVVGGLVDRLLGK